MTVLLGLGFVRVVSEFADVASTAYRDIFVSVTIPFGICALIYYIIFFHQIKKANEVFERLGDE